MFSRHVRRGIFGPGTLCYVDCWGSPKFSKSTKDLFSSIRAMAPLALNLILFNLEHFKTRFFDYLAFQIHTIDHGKHTHLTIIYEGASTCVMSLSYWWSIVSPNLNKFPITLKAFNAHRFNPYGILNFLIMELWGMTISIDVEVVDAPLYYNLFLGHSWFYLMTSITSSVFRTLQFLH